MYKFWGQSDASVSFCEKPYKKSPYIAEFYNTLSASAYFLVGLFFSFTKLKKIGYTLIFLSIGTAILHGTQRYYGQILDESSMLFLSFFIIEELRKLLDKYTNYFILSAIIGLYLSTYTVFSVFLFVFVSSQIYIVYLVKRVLKKRQITNIKLLLINSYLIMLSLSTVCWLLDQYMCTSVEHLNLHAFWHVGTAIAVFLGLLFLVI